MIALGILAATVFVSMLSSSDIQNKRDKQTAAALAEAKAALIGRAVKDDNRPGSLPCPDITNDGIAAMLNGTKCPNYIGRLPWRTLGIPDLRDGYGERLWYSLSVNLTDSAQTTQTTPPVPIPINGDTPLNIQVYASDKVTPLTSAGNEAAAVIFSAGPVLNGQLRDTANEKIAANYLDKTGTSPSDIDNANPSGPFIQGPVRDSAGNIVVNDKLLIITRHDLFSVVEKRIAGEIIGTDTPTIGLRGYYVSPGYYPYAGDGSGNEQLGPPASTSGYVPYNSLSFTTATKTMLISNNWFGITSYLVTISRDSAQLGLKYCTVTTTSGKQGAPVCH
ncbi:MAG: hypothetical protein V4528_01790 [Pseudomonadota bacterium]